MKPVDGITNANTTAAASRTGAQAAAAKAAKATATRPLARPVTVSDIADCSRARGLVKLTPTAAGAGTARALEPRDREAAEVLEAVKQFESVFLRYLASAMNKAMPGGESEMPGGQYYQGLIDTKLGELLAREQGLGLGEAMLRQLGHEPGGLNDDA